MIDTEGIKRSIQNELNELIGYQMEDNLLIDQNILNYMTLLTRDLGREILIMTDHKNRIYHVGIGDAASVELTHQNVKERRKHLNPIRIIHTHPKGSAYLSEEDYSSAENLSAQCILAIGVPEYGQVQFGIGFPVEKENQIKYALCLFKSLKQLNDFPLEKYTEQANRFLKKQAESGYAVDDKHEKALLIGVETVQNRQGIAIENSMQELTCLVETAGGEVAERVVQRREKTDPVFYTGRGKLLEIKKIIQNKQINLIVANDELNANQIACIEANTGIKTIDRTTIILDIFAKQAKTKEGKLQVELAQQKYRLSHLKGMGLVLSRTGGGIGTRGPGEKKLETDRRHIRKQIDELERRIIKINQTNTLNAKRRKKNSIQTVALIGYTNSGKSTLFNLMTDSTVVMKDALFVTLDSTMRKIRPEFGDYLLSDTVGFIEKLPHELVKAFKTTLMEVESADLLLHVVDISDSDIRYKIDVVNQVICDIGAGRKKVLTVYNKIDKVSEVERNYYQNLAQRQENAVCISAKTGDAIPQLSEMIRLLLKRETRTAAFLIPYEESKKIAEFHELAEVLETEYLETGIKITVNMSNAFPENRYRQYLITKEEEK